VSPTDDVGKILSAVHAVQLSNSTEETAAGAMSDITAAVSVASLALKHRRNKNGAQRIVLFVGTPVTAETKALQKAGRQLKKNNVAIDVVALGELEANEAKLQELVDAANGRSSGGGDADAAERTCHLVTIPAGVLPSDVLASSPVLAGGGGAFAAAAAAGGAFAGAAAGGDTGGGGGFADFGGVDPNMDPELAMALRVSMEEERARQERAAAAAAAETKDDDGGDEEGDTEMADAAAPAEAAAAAGLSEEDALLQQALAMSMNENDPNEEAGGEDSKPAAAGDEDEDVDMDEDAAMQMALQMSMAGGDDETPADAEEKKKKEEDDSKK